MLLCLHWLSYHSRLRQPVCEVCVVAYSVAFWQTNAWVASRIILVVLGSVASAASEPCLSCWGLPICHCQSECLILIKANLANKATLLMIHYCCRRKPAFIGLGVQQFLYVLMSNNKSPSTVMFVLKWLLLAGCGSLWQAWKSMQVARS